MAEFDVDPSEVRQSARDVAALAASLDSLARYAAALAQSPVRQHFPAIAQAQQTAARWDEARAAIATGIGRVALAASRLGDGLTQAATGYEVSDAHAAQRNEAAREQTA
ncbi:type VII secretion target [Allorhizocola rhizosphaerae]|uniref:type VII secretion target n=1 Tax=Allorhizocola rhizosphaerae TaxID=1872709 RepID=UPI0013C2D9ED|nr:type VII secretion target [Allorhizocola rhizosphaerae]